MASKTGMLAFFFMNLRARLSGVKMGAESDTL